MKMSMERSAGIALLLGAVLMLSTMVIHPQGGNLQHLLRVARITVISHALALLAIPFLVAGFWGLTQKIGVHHFLPLLSFIIMVTGLFAGMMAATINGLALPIYIQNYKETTVEVASSVRLILRNNIALNQAFDYVFLSAVSLSVLFWSISILTLKKLPPLIGYLGLLLSLSALVMLLSGFMFVNLHGFRLFVFAHVVWIILVGITLIRSNQQAMALMQ
jgi:hypothetical protein